MKIEYKEFPDANTVRVTTTDERWYLHPEKKIWVPSSTWIGSYVPSKDLAIWMAKKGYDEAELIKREAGAKGSRVHKGIEILSTGGEVKHNDAFTDGEGEYKELTAEEYAAIISFKEWCEEAKPKFLYSERTVFNLKDNYAGTLDAMVELNGEIYILDYKTSADIYLSHQVQISSYYHADDIIADKMAILQLGYKRNKHKKYKFTEVEDCYDLFLSAQKFWATDNKDKKPLQKDFPISIKLNGALK